jgi:Activator of Hsp90 ATPase homolog 1-like protein
MRTSTTEEAIQTLNISRETEIAAPIQVAFEALLEELGPASTVPGGVPMPMILEPWPGGRWYRDLGNNTGHHWGHVQVFKPPMLLEVCGPLFMSYPATSHLQYRLTAEGKGTRLQLTHRAFGLITDEHRKGVVEGWKYRLSRIREIAEGRNNERR